MNKIANHILAVIPRKRLIRQIKEHYGRMHETIQDKIYDSDDDELRFWLWRLENGWLAYDSDERLIQVKTKVVKSVDEVKELYKAA